jgi:lincosamide nucleotidyltransferase A/C/D/E
MLRWSSRGKSVGQYVMTGQSVVDLLEALQKQGAHPCVGGGWGVDALLGQQTRDHSDLDLWLPAKEFAQLIVIFAARGIDRILPSGDARPWNFVLHDGAGRRVDLDLYEPLPDETIHYGSVTDAYIFPATALEGHGSIAGTPVRCEAPEWAVRWHTGYPIRDIDRDDVSRLCTTFGLDLPDAYR